jgi:hypothetical protein
MSEKAEHVELPVTDETRSAITCSSAPWLQYCKVARFTHHKVAQVPGGHLMLYVQISPIGGSSCSRRATTILPVKLW